MRTFLAVFLVLAASMIALNHGLGQARLATAAPGVDSLVVNAVSCAGAGKVDATISWSTLNQGPQYVNWSLENNGFQPGTYTTSLPLPAGASSAILQGLPSTNAIYLMIGTQVGGQIDPGLVIVFSTAGYCQGTSQPNYPVPPYQGFFGGLYPNLGFDQSFLAHACQQNGFLPFHGTMPFHFFGDDEDEDDEDEEDEFDEDEEDELDDDEEDELDEDEDDEDDEDEGDEDEDDEDEDDFIFRRTQANPCLFFFGNQGNLVNWGTSY